MADLSNSTRVVEREFISPQPTNLDSGDTAATLLANTGHIAPMARASSPGRLSSRRSFMKSLSVASIAVALPVAAVAADTIDLQCLITRHRLAVDEYLHLSDLAEEIEYSPVNPIPIARVQVGLLSLTASEGRPLYVTSEMELRKMAEQRYSIWSSLGRDRESSARKMADDWYEKLAAELRKSQEQRELARHTSGLSQVERDWDLANQAEVAAAASLLAYRPRNEEEAVTKRAYLTAENGLSNNDIESWSALIAALVDKLSTPSTLDA